MLAFVLPLKNLKPLGKKMVGPAGTGQILSVAFRAGCIVLLGEGLRVNWHLKHIDPKEKKKKNQTYCRLLVIGCGALATLFESPPLYFHLVIG